MIGGWGTSYEIAFRWMSLDLADDKLSFVQVMNAWSRHGPLARYAKLRVRMRQESQERFLRRRR